MNEDINFWKTEEGIILNKKFETLNSICSYLAMFPSSVPERYITKYTNKGDLVFDPFSGRGTTTLQAIKLGRKSISNDLSPLAFVLTKAKTNKLSQEEVIARVKELEVEFNNDKPSISLSDKEFDGVKVFYSKKNLVQLKFLREKLGKKFKTLSNVDTYILAISLGIAHGQVKKSGDKNNSSYFSVSMPNGFSMAPAYAERYIKNNNLHKIETNIFEQIINRVNTRDVSIIKSDKNHMVNFGDALDTSKLFKNKKPKLIFTSPPYLNLIKYVDQNWIRFWILGFNYKSENTKQLVDDYHARESYKNFLKEFMLEMHKIMSNETRFMMVIGDVNNNKIKEIMCEIFEDENINLKLKYDNEDEFGKANPIMQPLKNKLSRQMGERVGKATENDWVFSFRRR